MALQLSRVQAEPYPGLLPSGSMIDPSNTSNIDVAMLYLPYPRRIITYYVITTAFLSGKISLSPDRTLRVSRDLEVAGV